MEIGSGWHDLAAQQLVRYEAIFTLLDDIKESDDIAFLANRVATQWKYFANVSSWRLVIFHDQGVLVIDGFRGEAKIDDTPILSEWDSYHRSWKKPSAIRLSDDYSGPLPPKHLAGKKIAEVRVLPFLENENLVALLSVAARHESFNDLDKKFIRIFGSHFVDQVSGIMFREQMTKKLIEKATKDALTGIYNRGAILEQLESRLALSRRENQPLSIILADIDFFKNINDRFGHLVGDHVLRGVTSRMQKELRISDSLGRYGGEEFLLILYPCDPDMIMKTAERFRLAVSSLPVKVDGSGQCVEVTMSLGVFCGTSRSKRSPDEILKLADDALYHSKAKGRNCVTLAPG